LIYIDPPFDFGADFSLDIEIAYDRFTKIPSVIEEIAYLYTWVKGADSFIAMIYERLLLMHDLMAEDGTIYVHCDWRVNSYIRIALDEVFGKNNFRNEIIWCYTSASNPGTDFPKKHDNIYRYGKSENTMFNAKDILIPYSEKTLSNYKEGLKGSGTFYGGTTKDTEGDILKAGKIPEDWWELAIAARFPVDGVKRTGYPTEKSWPLIAISACEGDIVHFFVALEQHLLLLRNWEERIVQMLENLASTSRKRLIEFRELKRAMIPAFEILNVGKYERDNYLVVNDDLRAEEKIKQAERKEKEFIKLIISAYKAETVDGFVNITGKKRDRFIVVGPISTPVSSKLIQEIVNECKEKNLTKVDVLGFDYEMGMDLQEYRDHIDIVLNYS
jgi:hypothetical protein